MYSFIVNPKTNRRVNINGELGKKILENYVNQIGGQKKLTREAVVKYTNRKNEKTARGYNKCRNVYSDMVKKIDKIASKSPKKALNLLDQLKKNNCLFLLSKGSNNLMRAMENNETLKNKVLKEINKRDPQSITGGSLNKLNIITPFRVRFIRYINL